MANDLAIQIKNSLEKEEAQTKILSFFGDDKEKATKFKSALVGISQSENLSKCSVKSIISSAFNLA
ncbi:hypothetical protein GHK77_09125, partial [Campylobacter jejuni]|nr:hypothetical protein [Campylobacter jejuni]